MTPGQVVLLAPKVSALVKEHIVHVEVHEDLYLYGVPTFKRKRTHHDSDMETGEGKPLLPRTVTDEDVDP